MYILFKNSKAVYITPEIPFTGTPKLAELLDAKGVAIDYDFAEDARRLKSFEQATAIAAELTTIMGETYVPVDDGDWTSHRFGVIDLPKVGDEVSYAFNGDYYPCGKITKITPSLRVTATDAEGHESTFFRRRTSGCWKKKGGTWSMIKGTHSRLNPEF